jgi:hypothetical protein
VEAADVPWQIGCEGGLLGLQKRQGQGGRKEAGLGAALPCPLADHRPPDAHVIGNGFGAFQGQLNSHRLGPMPTPAREARRRAIKALAHHQIGPVLAQQGWKLADQLLIATGTVGEGAPGHGVGRKVAAGSRLARTPATRSLALALLGRLPRGRAKGCQRRGGACSGHDLDRISPFLLATVTLPAPGSGATDARAHRTGQSRISTIG